MMWLFTRRRQVANKNQDKLLENSKKDKVPVAQLDCWFDSNKLQNGGERRFVLSHFERNTYHHHMDLCIGSRVAIKNWNILPSVGLYNGSIGKVFDIIYETNTIGPNNKEHNHLSD